MIFSAKACRRPRQ
jgi:hypothetical protein